MKLIANIADFLHELTFLERMVAKNPVIPVLGNVLLRATESGLVMIATDLEIGMITSCAAVVSEQGSITLPVRKVLDVLKAQSEKTFALSLNEKQQVTLKAGKFTSRLQALTALEYPKIPAIPEEKTPLDVHVLHKLLARTRYAVKSKDTRFFLNGVNLELKENIMLCIATDGTRLSVASADRVGSAYPSALLPTKTVDALMPLLFEAGSDPIGFARTDRHFFFSIEGRILISRVVDGTFPAYERIIPRENNCRITIRTRDLREVLERMTKIHEHVTFMLASGVLQLSALSNETGDAQESITVDYNAPDVTIKVNGVDVIDFLKTASETITIAVRGAKYPMLLLDGAQYLNVVMGVQ